MTTNVSSANKANLLNEDNEALYDPYPWFSLNAFCEIPFPEWSDAELNAEAWDEGKGTKTTADAHKSSFQPPPGPFFEDPHPPNLPPVVSNFVFLWKRPQEVFPDSNLTLYDPSNVEFELQVTGTIPPKCDFFKAFTEQLRILQFYALKYGFPVELETPNFVANTQGEAWRPWHHIYAMCKAGKGQVHKPLYCPYGKYVVRLFYMGLWRRFVVDDKIPCDIEGNCLLPVTQFEGELWPIILIKALLKILSLTQTQDFEVTDFSLLSALTGWTHGSFSAVNKTSEQIWRRLLVLCPLYEISEKDLENEGKAITSSIKNPSVKKESSKKEPERVPDKEALAQKFCFLFADLKQISFGENLFFESTVPVTMIRDCPLTKATKREGTKPWKRIRWVYWAKEKGLWVDENLLPPYRRLQIITFFKKLCELLTPDPKLETIMYAIPASRQAAKESEEEEEDEKGLKPVENMQFGPEQWCDYLEFLKYLSSVNVFFKPSCFNFNFKITCLKDKSLESAPAGKAAPKVQPPQTSFIFPFFLKDSCNEPILLLCESLTGIFLSISLWVYPQKQITSVGYLKADQPKLLKIGHASLVIERFDWRSFEQGEIIGVVKTVGYSVVGLNLKPGRHLLKLWLYSDSPYVIEVNSNVTVFIQKSPRIRSLMNSESQRILNYITSVSNAFMTLTQKFGKSELPLALQDFYNTIKPGHDGIIGYFQKLDDFIETFLNSILLVLKDLIPSGEEILIMMGALRSLFLNPNIQCDLPPGATSTQVFGGSSKKQVKKAVTFVKERTLSEILNCIWMPEEIEKITMIQRIFRGYRVRLLWKCQTPSRKEFKPYTERLKKICDTVFAPPKREVEVGKLLRKIIINKYDLLTTFKFYEDFANVIQVEEFSGKIPNVDPSAWVPIARFIIACHCEGFVPCAFHLSCNLEQFVIQGFNNDTGDEIFRTTNSVSPHYYHSNARGYTIFIFGWNEANSKTVNWRLEMVKMKYFQVIHLCNALISSTCHPYSMPSVEVFDVKNFYIPNSKSRICRCLIKVQKRTLVTLRFSTSYPYVQFALMILLDKRFCTTDMEFEGLGKVVAKVTSTNGAVIVPSLILDYFENLWWGESFVDTNSTIYIIEAQVLDDSWPLTKQEWGLIEPLRVNGESFKESLNNLQNKRGGSESRKKLARSSKKSFSEQKIAESPTWNLQVLSDSSGTEPGEQIVVEEDKSFAESLKAMKMSWEEKDPGRRQRGKDLRMNFLYAIYLEERKQQMCSGEDFGEADSFGNDKCDEFYDNPQALLDRLSSLSYLLNDVSPVRYRYSPRIMPTTPLCELLCKHKRLLKSISANNLASLQLLGTGTQSCHSFDYQTETSSKIATNIIDEMEENRKDYLKQFQHYRYVMVSHLYEEQKLSNQLMEEAYTDRLKAIERILR